MRPVGSTSEIVIDVRVIAATNRDLDKARGRERVSRRPLLPAQCYSLYRVPSLRERREDIPLLANHFLKKYASAAGRSIPASEQLHLWMHCAATKWPGNVRQLENTVERAVALEDDRGTAR